MSNGVILPLVVFVCLFYIILHLNKKVEEWRDESIRQQNEIGDIISLIKRKGLSDEIFDRNVFKND